MRELSEDEKQELIQGLKVQHDELSEQHRRLPVSLNTMGHRQRLVLVCVYAEDTPTGMWLQAGIRSVKDLSYRHSLYFPLAQPQYPL